MVGLIIIALALVVLIYLTVDIIILKKYRNKNKTVPVKPTITSQDMRNNISLDSKGYELEDELIQLILTAHPHLKIGNRLTSPVGVTIKGKAPTKQDYDAIEMADSLTQATALTKLHAVSFKIFKPFNIDTIKSFELHQYEYIHIYEVCDMLPEGFKVGATIKTVDADFNPIEKVLTEQDFNNHNFVILRCAFS